MNTWDWLIRALLAALLVLAAYAMGLGWSALRGEAESAASESLWINLPGSGLSNCASWNRPGASFPCLSSVILLSAAKGRCPARGAFFIRPFGRCEPLARPAGDRLACVAKNAVPDRTQQLCRA
jgi:hypothetical protein